MNRELIQQFDRLKRNERHRNKAETAYWCNQYKLFARHLLSELLAKPTNEFHPDWDTLKPYHDRIAELEAQLAKPEQPDLRKAAEMALDALENNLPLIEDYGSKEQLNIHHKAIAALYKTLAQPEQDHGFDRTASHMAGEYVDTAPPKQWVGLTDDEILSFVAFEPHPLMNKTSIIHAVQAKLREKNG